MTPKEKAKELVEKYLPLVDCGDNRYTTKVQKENSKQCALIAVDQIIRLDIFDCNDEWSDEEGDTKEYWKEVKQEIQKL